MTLRSFTLVIRGPIIWTRDRDGRVSFKKVMSSLDMLNLSFYYGLCKQQLCDKEESNHRLINDRVFSLNYLLINLLTQLQKNPVQKS